LTVRTAVSSVKPATKTAARISVAPAPGASTLPTATSSTRAGLILERSRMAFRTPARRSPAGVSLKAPLPPLVKAVRQAAVMTTYCDIHVSICYKDSTTGKRGMDAIDRTSSGCFSSSFSRPPAVGLPEIWPPIWEIRSTAIAGRRIRISGLS
jgi:hypothetical protein